MGVFVAFTVVCVVIGLCIMLDPSNQSTQRRVDYAPNEYYGVSPPSTVDRAGLICIMAMVVGAGLAGVIVIIVWGWRMAIKLN